MAGQSERAATANCDPQTITYSAIEDSPIIHPTLGMSTPQRERFEWALKYAQLGWILVPLVPYSRPDLVPDDPVNWCKKPYLNLLKSVYGTNQWGHLKHHPAVADDVVKWFEYDPDINLGGRPFNGSVIDFDHGIPDDLHLPRTPRDTSGRGGHFYFCDRWDGGQDLYHPETGAPLGELINTGYVVLPPSMHPFGKPYTWTVDPTVVQPISLPEWIYRATKGDSKGLEMVTIEELMGTPKTPTETRGGTSNRPEWLTKKLGAIHEWNKDEDFIAKSAALVGIPARCATGAGIGVSFPCVLPKHEEKSASASLFRTESGIYYRDFHSKEKAKVDGQTFKAKDKCKDGDDTEITVPQQSYSLAEVFMHQHYGYVKSARRIFQTGNGQWAMKGLERDNELTTWMLRMGVEVGAIQPAQIDAPNLPPEAPEDVVKAWNGFIYLLACKGAGGYFKVGPSAYSARMAGAWCGLTPQRVSKAVKWLMSRGYLAKVGYVPSRFRNHPTTIFDIGDPREIAAREATRTGKPLQRVTAQTQPDSPEQQGPPPRPQPNPTRNIDFVTAAPEIQEAIVAGNWPTTMSHEDYMALRQQAVDLQKQLRSGNPPKSLTTLKAEGLRRLLLPRGCNTS